MKHSIVLKFIAVILCAASLLGAAGSALGIFAMAELGLYERSFDDAYEEYAETFASLLAEQIAVRYAATALGGCNTQLADAYYGNLWSNSSYDFNNIGYRLLNENEEVLQNYRLEMGTPEFTFPVSRKYMKVLSTMTEEEKNAQEMVTAPVYGGEEGIHVTAVPDGDTDVYGFTIRYSNGSSEGTSNENEENPVGYLSRQEDGSILFQSYENLGWLGLELADSKTPVYISFQDVHGVTVYEAYSEANVIDHYSYQGDLTTIGLFGQTAETDRGEPVIYDALPADGAVAATIAITYADGSGESVGGAPGIGHLGYDAYGNVCLTFFDSGIIEPRQDTVTRIAFLDDEGNCLYEAADADGVGSFYYDEGETLCFRVELQKEAVPAETTADEVYIYDDVPPQGHAVHTVELWLEGSSSVYTVVRDDPLGFASHDDGGNVTFLAYDWQDFEFSKPAKVVYLLLLDEDNRVLYESYTKGNAHGQGGVIGTFAYNGDGELVFTVVQPEEADTAVPSETVPETATSRKTTGENSTAAGDGPIPAQTEPPIAATVPEEETVPETTAEATVPETTDVTVPVTAAEEEEVPKPTEATAAAAETVVPEVTTPKTRDSEIAPTEVVDYGVVAAAEGVRYFAYYDHDLDEHMVAEYTYAEMPEYTVEIQFAPGALANDYEWQLLRAVYMYRNDVLILLGVSLLVFAIMAVYLCCAAGRKSGREEIRAGGLNCIPLDLYAMAAVAGTVALCIMGVEGAQYLMRSSREVGFVFALLMAFAACLLIVGFCFACAAQFKTPGGYWWRNSLCGFCLRLIARCWKWLIKAGIWLGKKCGSTLWPALVRFLRACWKLVRFFWGLIVKSFLWLGRLLKKGIAWLGGKFTRFFGMLPVTWQWLLAGFILIMVLIISLDGFKDGNDVMLPIGLLVAFGLILYGAHCFGVLLESAKRMSKGDLDAKVDDKLLIGSFREFADELNGLADVAVVAAQKQLKSERMKTELITNVSHDIKTPLTSIINYVDLLQKPHTGEEQEVYLEVLDRQSQRLKKLVEDLMEMSKASTGNLAVDIQKVDAAETVNQALGEFADKLDKAQLIPVFRHPEKPIAMMADGRLVWRVMSNLLGNAVKYALPGTRVYLDLVEMDGKVIISMKNISREELNVQADELLERFVRGDISRNTEGSGLGLNIAQSLMELQKGQLQLLVDGDLFKVTLIFPGA